MRNKPKEAHERLRIRVNEELVLDAGSCEEASGLNGREWLIRPPGVSLFRQVVDYLRTKPDPVGATGSMISREGVATAAVVLRWGSYLAVLLDRDRPLWAEVKSPETSRISDQEMARINIESSAALAEWIDIYRRNPCGGLYASLVEKAVAYLPMPRRRSRREIGPFAALAKTEFATQLMEAATPTRLEQVRAAADRHPSRMYSNALVNVAWRNGPIEDIHAGESRGYPITHRRISVAEERTLMRFTSDRMAMGMWTCFGLCVEQPPRRWPEQVLPYGLASMLLITPASWTLTEASREVRIPFDSGSNVPGERTRGRSAPTPRR